MQILKTLFVALSFIILLASCNTKANDATNDPILVEANGLHLEAMEVEKTFVPLLNEVIERKNSIQVQGRELNQEELNFVDFADKVERYFKEWQDNRVEVPGFEHAHDHSGHDHHHHGNDVQLTPEQMLEVQKQSYKDLNTMKAKVEVYLQK